MPAAGEHRNSPCDDLEPGRGYNAARRTTNSRSERSIALNSTTLQTALMSRCQRPGIQQFGNQQDLIQRYHVFRHELLRIRPALVCCGRFSSDDYETDCNDLL